MAVLSPDEDNAIKRLRHDAAKRVSDWFEPHPDQITTCYRGDLQILLDVYDKLKRAIEEG